MIDQPSRQDKTSCHPPVPIPGINFRLARHEDLRGLQTYCYPETEWAQFQDHIEFLLKWQANGRCHILLAETSGSTAKLPEIVGSGQLIRRFDTAEIADLVVREPFQNRGIGTALIQILTRFGRSQQVDQIEIVVSVYNKAALNLYRRLGFDIQRQVTLPGPEEAIFLSKPLRNGDK